MTAEPTATSAVAGVILAAGRSRRFGGDRPKQLLDFHGEPMVRRVARRALASRLERVIVVVGYRGTEVADAVAGLEVEVADNPGWETGLASSVTAGLAAARSGGDPPATLFIPADQPLLRAEDSNRLISAWEETAAAIVQPVYQARPGAPVLFVRSLFDELSRLSGEEGGRQVIARYPELVHRVKMESEAALLDVDTAERYAAMMARRGNRVQG